MLIERLAIAVASIVFVAQSHAAPPEWITPSDKAEGMFDIRWPGGPLMDLFEGLDEIDGASFIVPQSASMIDLEAFNIDDAWPEEVMEIVGLLRPGIEARFIGGTASIMTDDGVVEDIDRGANFVISIADHLVDRAGEENDRFDIDFEGGPLKAYARAVHKAAGEKKIVVMEAVEDLPVPAIELTNVTIEDTARLLVNMLGVRIEFVEEIVVIQMETDQPQKRAAEAVLTYPWSVGEIIERGFDQDDILAAIDATIGLAGGNTQIAFHADTGILIAHGTATEINVISQVIGRLRDNTEGRITNEELEQRIRNQRAEVSSLEIELRLMNDQVAHTKAILDEAEKLHANEEISAIRLSESRMELNQVKAKEQKMLLHVEAARRELEALEERLQTSQR